MPRESRGSDLQDGQFKPTHFFSKTGKPERWIAAWAYELDRRAFFSEFEAIHAALELLAERVKRTRNNLKKMEQQWEQWGGKPAKKAVRPAKKGTK